MNSVTDLRSAKWSSDLQGVLELTESHPSLIYEIRQEIWAEMVERYNWNEAGSQGLSISLLVEAHNIELEFEHKVRNLVFFLGWDGEHSTQWKFVL